MKLKFTMGAFAAIGLQSLSAQIVINETDAQTPGFDIAEFVEIYDGGTGSTSLAGHAMVFFNGSDDAAYYVIDLGSLTTDADGFLLLGNASFGLPAAQTFPDSTLQNGADAIAIYNGTTAADFIATTTTAATSTDLVDAVVYDTNDGDDTVLLTTLGETVQTNEDENGDDDNESISRNPDGSETFVVGVPTPGISNSTPILTIQLLVNSSPVTSFTEGTDGPTTGEIVVARTGDTSSDLTVDISTDLPGDLSVPSTITIFAGDVEGFDSFGPINDNDVEATETATVTASATSSGFSSVSASVDILDDDTPATLIINEILYDGPNGFDVNGDGVSDGNDFTNNEFVELANVSGGVLDISGYTLSDGAGVRHTFPAGTTLDDGCAIVVFGGPSTFVPSPIGTTLVQVADTGALGLSNGGDTVTIADGGGTTVTTYSYSSGVAGNDESLNLNPDFTAGTTYSAHSSLGSADYSPGTTVNGDDPCATQFLSLVLAANFVTETDTNPATIATVTRTGADTSADLTVTLTSLDVSEVTLPATVTILAGQLSAIFDVTVVDDQEVDGDREVELTATAAGFGTGTDTITVVDAGDTFTAPAALVINEVWADDRGNAVDYVELFGTPGAPLSGISLVMISSDVGFEGVATYIYEFTSEVIPADGFFLLVFDEDSPTALTALADVEIGSNFVSDFGQTIALVPTADLYTDSSGNVTSASLTAMGSSVIDSVANTGVGAAVVYLGAPQIVSPTNFPADVIARTADGVDTDTAADWAVQDNFDLDIRWNDANDSLSTAGSTNSPSNYSVEITACTFTGSAFDITFTATGISDVYVSTNLTSWTLAPDGEDVNSGSYLDPAPPSGEAFYLIQEADSPAP